MTKSCDVMKVESRTYLLSDKMSEWIFSDYPGEFRQEKEKVPESILFAFCFILICSLSIVHIIQSKYFSFGVLRANQHTSYQNKP